MSNIVPDLRPYESKENNNSSFYFYGLIRSDMSALRNDLKNDIHDVKNDIRDLKNDIRDLKNDTNTRFNGINTWLRWILGILITFFTTMIGILLGIIFK